MLKDISVFHKYLKGMDCGICLETITSNASCIKCGHIFHTKCIKPWVRSRNLCPICQKGFRESELIRIFDGKESRDVNTRGRTLKRTAPIVCKLSASAWLFKILSVVSNFFSNVLVRNTRQKLEYVNTLPIPRDSYSEKSYEEFDSRTCDPGYYSFEYSRFKNESY